MAAIVTTVDDSAIGKSKREKYFPFDVRPRSPYVEAHWRFYDKKYIIKNKLVIRSIIVFHLVCVCVCTQSLGAQKLRSAIPSASSRRPPLLRNLIWIFHGAF